MATVLRLDKNALMYLIEVMGEEFKIELSKAVVANASRAIVRNVIPEQMAKVVREAAEREVEEQIGRVKGSWNNRQIIISDDVRDAIGKLVWDKANELKDQAYAKFLEEFDKRIEYALGNVEYLVKREVDKIKKEAIQQEIRDRLAEIVAATTESIGE